MTETTINTLPLQTSTILNKDVEPLKESSPPTSWTNRFGVDIFVPQWDFTLAERLMRVDSRNFSEAPLWSGDYTAPEIAFLGPDENLLDVIANDRAAVQSMGITHEPIASALRYAFDQAKAQYGVEDTTFEYQGRSYKIISNNSMLGFQNSPFLDGAINNGDIILENKEGQQLFVSGFLPDFISRFHFYNGMGALFKRIDPEYARLFFHLEMSESDKVNIDASSLSPARIRKLNPALIGGYPIRAIERRLVYDGHFLVAGESIVSTITSDLERMIRHAIDPKRLAVRLQEFLEVLEARYYDHADMADMKVELNGKLFDVEVRVRNMETPYLDNQKIRNPHRLFRLKPVEDHLEEMTLSFQHLILIKNYHFFGGHQAPMRLDPLELDRLLPGGRTHHRQVYERLPAHLHSKTPAYRRQSGFSTRAMLRR